MPILEDIETTQHFLCENAICRLPFNKKIRKYLNAHDVNLDMSFLTFLNEYAYDLQHIQKITQLKWLILKKNKANKYSVLYDGRFFDFVQY